MTASGARRYFLLAGVCVALQACAPSDEPHFPADEDLEVMLRYLVEDGEARAIVLGVLEPDGSTRIVGYGSSGTEGSAVGPRSSFEIGSITKTFTATLLAHMVARGEVSLDDPVSMYLPDGVATPTFGGREITLVDLATHTSGLSDSVLATELAGLGQRPLELTVEGMYELLSGYSLEREPGAAFEYSNFGMGLLGYALGRAAGSDFSDLVAERILEPLGMDQTTYAPEDVPSERRVQGFYAGEAIPAVVPTDALEGAGGLRSSARDLLRFLAANVGAPESDLERAVRVAHEPRHSTGGGDIRVGLAWQTVTLNGRELIGHGGDTDGFTARMFFDPERRVGAVVLTNSREYDNDLARDLVVHDPIVAAESVNPSPEALASKAGTYVINGLPFFVRLEDDGYLTVQPTEDVRMRLYAVSDTLFFTKREEWAFAFPPDTAGDADILMYVNGTQRAGRRIDVPAPPPRQVAGNVGLPVSAADASRYEGVYDVPVGGRTLELMVHLAEASGRLESVFAGTPSRLIPAGEHEFVVVVNPTIRLSFTVEDGRARGVTLRQGSRSDSGARRR